jgi:hypothetical protein
MSQLTYKADLNSLDLLADVETDIRALQLLWEQLLRLMPRPVASSRLDLHFHGRRDASTTKWLEWEDRT